MKINGPFPFAVFVGSFLLFQIQPLIGKYFLPWFGGASAVWLTCLMFFQLLLLGGYAYAHFLQRLRKEQQAALHAGLLMAALFLDGVFIFLWGSPILPDQSWRPDNINHPILSILRLLLISIGLSYFLLSASASLLQAWFHRVRPERSPYIFYIISNTAALLALLSYPFLIEPHLTIRQQVWLWSGSFAVYVAFCTWCALLVWKKGGIQPGQDGGVKHNNDGVVSASRKILWTLLSFCGVLALMAITNKMTEDVPPVPFLWILPLFIYLLSYIIGFMEKQRRWTKGYSCLMVIAFGSVIFLSRQGLNIEIRQQIAIYSFILLSICLFCQNMLYRIKPDPKHLTGFYLCISLGGALGGLFTVTVAPFIFKRYWEYQMVLILAGALAVFFVYTDSKIRQLFGVYRHLFPAFLAAFTVFLGWGIVKEIRESVYMGRNFFGCVQVLHNTVMGVPMYDLRHGKITHGVQFDNPVLRYQPTLYYAGNSGVGLTLLLKQQNPAAMHVGVIGLGIGTLAIYGREMDFYRMYEINPAVIQLAQSSPWFSYLHDSYANIKIIPGDGRISLEHEPDNHFDVLVLDAYSGDQIPVQTLTLEAFELYLRHMAADGVIAVHISNRSLDLLPVLMQVRKHFNLYAAYVHSKTDEHTSADAHWVLLSRDLKFMQQPVIAQADLLKQMTIRDIRPWTDDYSNLLCILK